MFMDNPQKDARRTTITLNASVQAAPRFKVVLINPYELGRQPFALAQPAAWLGGDGFSVVCLDLALQKLEPAILARAGLVALHLGMHTATRIAVAALPRIQKLAPEIGRASCRERV